MTENKTTLPSNIKPGTLTAFVYELGQENPRMTVDDMIDRIAKKFPGNDFARSTILGLRSSFGIRERNMSTPPNAKSAAPKRRGPDKKPRKTPVRKKRTAGKRLKRAEKLATASTNGHPAVTRIIADDAATAYRRLVARIGTDAARKHLEEIEKVL